MLLQSTFLSWKIIMQNLYKFDRQRQRQGIPLRHHPGKLKKTVRTVCKLIIAWNIFTRKFNLKYWITSEVVEVKNDKIFNFRSIKSNCENQKSLVITTETGNINDWNVISEYNNEPFSKLLTFLAFLNQLQIWQI